MASGCGHANGANGAAAVTNLAFTKFLFVIGRADDEAQKYRHCRRSVGSGVLPARHRYFSVSA